MKTKDLKKVADDYAEKIRSRCQSGHSEDDHCTRDELLEEFCEAIGCGQVAEASRDIEEEIGFWYA